MRPRTILITIAFLALASVPLALSGSDGLDSFGEEETYFQEGPYHCEVIDDSVAINHYDPEEPITDLVIPDKISHNGKTYEVNYIYGLFEEDELVTVTVPASIFEIEFPCFSGKNLRSIYVDEDNHSYASEDGVIFNHEKNKLLEYPKGREETSYTVPESVTIINDSAFFGCALEAVYLPNGLISIEMFAFGGCTLLERINDYDESNKLPSNVNIVDDYAFSECVNLKELVFPDSLRIIGDYAFSFTGLTSVTIPWNLTSLGEGAFSHCYDLKQFISDENEKYLAYDGVLYEKNSSLNLFCYPAGKTDKTFEVDEAVSGINTYSFAGARNLEKVTIPKNILILQNYTFFECTNLKEINLENVVILENRVFDSCTSLKNVQLGSQLSSIGYSCFRLTAIEEITLPKSLYYLNMSAFDSCKQLKKVIIPEDSFVEIDFYTFTECYNLEEIDVYSTDVMFDAGSLNIGVTEEPASVKVVVPKGYDLPDDVVTNEWTTVDVEVMGERPYPWENLIGVAFCILIVIMILKFFREV